MFVIVALSKTYPRRAYLIRAKFVQASPVTRSQLSPPHRTELLFCAPYLLLFCDIYNVCIDIEPDRTTDHSPGQNSIFYPSSTISCLSVFYQFCFSVFRSSFLFILACYVCATPALSYSNMNVGLVLLVFFFSPFNLTLLFQCSGQLNPFRKEDTDRWRLKRFEDCKR